jgi:hypothetical protein
VTTDRSLNLLLIHQNKVVAICVKNKRMRNEGAGQVGVVRDFLVECATEKIVRNNQRYVDRGISFEIADFRWGGGKKIQKKKKMKGHRNLPKSTISLSRQQG